MGSLCVNPVEVEHYGPGITAKNSAPIAAAAAGRLVKMRRTIEPNIATTRYDYMARLSPAQKRTDLLFGSTALGVLLLTAISGLFVAGDPAVLWLVILPPRFRSFDQGGFCAALPPLDTCKKGCPLYPRKRTCAAHMPMSDKCQ